jgi:3-phosphoshikimate 1-carboxyvinyltransferase
VRAAAALNGSFHPPGDKSISHRAVLFGLLAGGRTRVDAPNLGRDVEASIACCEQLGAVVHRRPGGLELEGRDLALAEPDRVLDCGNSGTTLRLLSGVLAFQPFVSVLQGDASLNRRPVARVVEPLQAMGASLWARGGDAYPPLAIRGGRLRGIEYTLPMASAQVSSCVLLAGLGADGRTTVRLPGPARDHTERMLRLLGVRIDVTPEPNGGRTVTLEPGGFRGSSLCVPGDFSAAAFFLSAAAASPGARVTALGVNVNPTRAGLLDVLERMGARIERSTMREESGEEVVDLTVEGPERLAPTDIPAAEVPRLIDEIPAWMIAAVRAHGTSTLSGASELRVKESDRIQSICANLSRLGVSVREMPDGFEVTGSAPRGGQVDAGGDHRIAMAFALLGCFAQGPLTIHGAEGIGTSNPRFVETLTALGGKVTQVGEAPAA